MPKGKTINHYTIIQKIEDTNTATVYKVKGKKGTCQALKRAKTNTRAHNDLILREFQILQQLSHPNIVKVMDLDSDTEGRAFFLQPFCGLSP